MTSVRFLKDPSGLVGSRSCGGTHEIRPICVITAQIQVGPHGGEHYLDPSFPPEHGKPPWFRVSATWSMEWRITWGNFPRLEALKGALEV